MPDMPVTPGQDQAGTTASSDGAYILAANEAEHARLIELAEHAAVIVRELCADAGVGEGARVVDVGCGPVGALLELSQVVGPAGTIVGVDSSAAAVETARAIVARQGLGNVSVAHGDINTMDLAVLTADGLFDAAHLRLVLVHQTDPATTLRRVARLLRPGGAVLVFDLLAHPRYDPPVPASERAWELLRAVWTVRGVAQNVGFRLPRLCEEAGLSVLHARGVFSLTEQTSFALSQTRGLLLGARQAIVEAALSTEEEIDRLADELAAAETQEFVSFISYLMVQVIAEAPPRD